MCTRDATYLMQVRMTSAYLLFSGSSRSATGNLRAASACAGLALVMLPDSGVRRVCLHGRRCLSAASQASISCATVCRTDMGVSLQRSAPSLSAGQFSPAAKADRHETATGDHMCTW